MGVCAIKDKTAAVVLHRIAAFQEIPFVSRPCLRRLRSDLLNPKFGNQKSASL